MAGRPLDCVKDTARMGGGAASGEDPAGVERDGGRGREGPTHRLRSLCFWTEVTWVEWEKSQQDRKAHPWLLVSLIQQPARTEQR